MSPGKRRRAAEVVRRQRTRRLDVVTLLALLIPLLTIGVLFLVQQPPVHDTTKPPTLSRLTNVTVVCPAAQPGSPDAAASTASGASGKVTVTSDSGSRSVPVKTGGSTPLHGNGAQVIRGAGDLAPGLLGLRSGTAPLTAQDCGVPQADQWFTGVGARADHDSVIELVNPDDGPANVDITLYARHEIDSHRLRGLTVPAHKTLTIDLGKQQPQRALLTAQVQVTRGRLAVHMLDTRTDLATHRSTREWVPRQSAPDSSLQLLGLPLGAATRTLQLANPGDEVVRADVKVVTGDTTFAPKGLEPVSIQPGSTTAVPLTKVLATALRDGALGIAVDADGPVTASVLTDFGNDRVVTVPNDDVREQAATLMPTAKSGVRAEVLLSADSAGSSLVTAYDGNGKQVLKKRVAQQQGHTVVVRLPRGAAYVDVVPDGTVVRGAVVVTGNGASVSPLGELLTKGLVPQISPGLG